MATPALIPELDAAGLRRFGLTTGAIVAVLFGLVLPWLFGFALPLWPWPLAALLVAWALLAPASMRGFYRGWMRLGLLLSRVTTPLVMGVVFYFVFAPVGLVMRLFRWDGMRRRLGGDADSYREPSERPGREHFERPF